MYLFLKALHILSVVLFLGNIITGVFWKVHADLAGDLRSRAQALDGIIRSDRWFTVPGVMLIIVTGVLLAYLGDLPLLRTFWIGWSLVLFGVSGAVFMALVAPLQKKMLANVRAGLDGGWDRPAYDRLSRSWAIWGGVATMTPVIALFLMVLKPVLPEAS
jgi:uncharacterized membrane protein